MLPANVDIIWLVMSDQLQKHSMHSSCSTADVPSGNRIGLTKRCIFFATSFAISMVNLRKRQATDAPSQYAEQE